MLTPKFEVTQDDEFVFVTVIISSIRFNAAGLEMVVNDNVFVFHLSPYYLRLRFPYNIVDDERSTAKYQAGNETIKIQLPKEEKGKFFEDLDVPTKLLARQGDLIGADTIDENKKEATGPLIQEIDVTPKTLEVENIQSVGEAFNWEIEQTPHDVADGLLAIKYGFENQYNSIIQVSVSNGNDINELNDPEHTSANDRVEERLQKENLKFDPEYYVSEYMIFKHESPEDLEINGIQEILKYTPPVVKEYLKWYKKSNEDDKAMPVEFTEKEQNQMHENIPRKEYLVSDAKRLYITILSLLFAHVFTLLETEGTQNPEIPWTIGKLTPQISSLDQQLLTDDAIKYHSIIKAAIVTGIRRSLSYPLHRNYELSLKAWTFVYYLLRGGKRLVIKCLLNIHEVFRYHDVYYVYNKMLLDDLCSWFISQGNETVIKSLAIETKKEIDLLTKEDIGFECMSDFNPETGEPIWENMTIKEMEILAEIQYQESQLASDQQS
ncbi:hypothetical protein HG535_0D02200 [Zygotorulaspora mrakii]|uniref:CS domain-containing protein n=1 Tax=Zygotorulaspora mrakii TaxID=42260 RepID=A0A7H9B437_ZYGMR|nr:uncharacterized protein HG535_0D02200 [Zygotorulaspora mrakii]QLG72512.1 hypothetical protein HG535_0D02200 [Zygotorulaspora mrakii]